MSTPPPAPTLAPPPATRSDPLPTWVLLRGLTRGRAHWGVFPERWSERWAECEEGGRVICPDWPGNGEHWQQATPADVPTLTEALRQALRDAGVVPPYAVLAMSLGAMVTCDWAQRHPQELAGVVLINTSLRPFSPFWRRLQPGRYPGLLSLPWRSPARREAWILRNTSQRAVADPARRDEVLSAWVTEWQQHPVSAANAVRQLRAAVRYCAPVEAPQVPMLLLNGARDALVHPSCSRALARAWHLPLRVHPEAGHDLPLDDPDWVMTQVRDWWTSMAPTRPTSGDPAGSPQ